MSTTPEIDLRFKKIRDYTQAELDYAVDEAEAYCKRIKVQSPTSVGVVSLDFWQILRGVDAYMERRRRKEETRT